MYTLTEWGEGCFSPSKNFFCKKKTCESPPSLGGDTLHESNRARSRLSILVSLQQDGYAAVIVADVGELRLTENGLALAAKARRSGGPLLAMTATPQEWMRGLSRSYEASCREIAVGSKPAAAFYGIVEAMPEISFWDGLFSGAFPFGFRGCGSSRVDDLILPPALSFMT